MLAQLSHGLKCRAEILSKAIWGGHHTKENMLGPFKTFQLFTVSLYIYPFFGGGALQLYSESKSRQHDTSCRANLPLKCIKAKSKY